ncbi:hypothetical protein HOS16_gp45 [Shigella phage vB_SflS-ISF001]|uniref:Uncharacterized protein n=1 Tax=Shigella phage vB_SflS-ISF001 TaxID=2048005 RepID=A0A2D1GQA8_9CAUD|nr:hypothetical protein HOS16_gp45 [Shigella phage vB_SflS-ISF001]ATN94123.1 hypothetical protein FLXISF001_045 [Shigella phage vB_SflS-ISF001]
MQNIKDESVKIVIKGTRTGKTTPHKKRLNTEEAVTGRIDGVMIKAQEDEAIQS